MQHNSTSTSPFSRGGPTANPIRPAISRPSIPTPVASSSATASSSFAHPAAFGRPRPDGPPHVCPVPTGLPQPTSVQPGGQQEQQQQQQCYGRNFDSELNLRQQLMVNAALQQQHHHQPPGLFPAVPNPMHQFVGFNSPQHHPLLYPPSPGFLVPGPMCPPFYHHPSLAGMMQAGGLYPGQMRMASPYWANFISPAQQCQGQPSAGQQQQHLYGAEVGQRGEPPLKDAAAVDDSLEGQEGVADSGGAEKVLTPKEAGSECRFFERVEEARRDETRRVTDKFLRDVEMARQEESRRLSQKYGFDLGNDKEEEGLVAAQKERSAGVKEDHLPVDYIQEQKRIYHEILEANKRKLHQEEADKKFAAKIQEQEEHKAGGVGEDEKRKIEATLARLFSEMENEIPSVGLDGLSREQKAAKLRNQGNITKEIERLQRQLRRLDETQKQREENRTRIDRIKSGGGSASPYFGRQQRSSSVEEEGWREPHHHPALTLGDFVAGNRVRVKKNNRK